MAATRTDQTTVDERGAPAGRWSLVALVGAGELFCSVALGYAFLVFGTSVTTVAFAVATFLFSLSLPFTIYHDYRRLERAGLGWNADLARYVAGAMIGASFVVISLVVAATYLGQRYRHVAGE